MFEERHFPQAVVKNDSRTDTYDQIYINSFIYINRTSKLNENRDQQFLHVVLSREREKEGEDII